MQVDVWRLVTDQGAARVVLSYRAPGAGDGEWPLADDGWIAEHLDVATFTTYLKRVHGGPVEEGEEWEEFVTRGCSNPRDVALRVETLEGGSELGDDTEIEFVPRRDVVE